MSLVETQLSYPIEHVLEAKSVWHFSCVESKSAASGNRFKQHTSVSGVEICKDAGIGEYVYRISLL